MKKLIALLALVALTVSLTACGTIKLNSQLDSLKGQHIDQFVAKRGNPTKVSQLSSGGKLYEWNITNRIQPDAAPGGNNNVNVSTNVILGQNNSEPERWCNYRIVTDKNDIVQDASWEGNFCRAAR